MIKQEEQQILIEAPAILIMILVEHGEQHACSEVARLVDVAESATARADAAEQRIADLEKRLNAQLRDQSDAPLRFEVRSLQEDLGGTMVTVFHVWDTEKDRWVYESGNEAAVRWQCDRLNEAVNSASWDTTPKEREQLIRDAQKKHWPGWA